MSFKRRRLSASPSSRSSTPALPASSSASGLQNPHPDSNSALALAHQSASSPAVHSANGDLPESGPPGFGRVQDQEPALGTTSATPVPPDVQGQIGKEPRFGTLVPGSGDGEGYGEECYNWGDLPLTRGYRYVPCALSPYPSPSPLIPFYRSVPYPAPCPAVHLDWLDRSSFLRLSRTALTCTSDRGFRSGRANVSVREGRWYYEAIIERSGGPSGAGGRTGLVGVDQKPTAGPAQGSLQASGQGHGQGQQQVGGNPHVRVGWARREANLDGPVGMDGYGYALRDVSGEKVHLSRPRPYGQPFQTGDVIGCLIILPPRTAEQKAREDLPDHPAYVRRKRFAIKWRGQHYFEMSEYTIAKEMEGLVDREGKGAKAAKAAAEAAKANGGSGHGPTNGNRGNGETDEGGGGGMAKKGATTKHAKKGKTLAGEAGNGAGSTARPLDTLRGSRIEFYLNGEPLGTAYEDLYDFVPLPPVQSKATKKGHGHGHAHEPKVEVQHDDGTLGYFPMVSCFGRGKVRVNFGPEWVCPPRWSEAALAGAGVDSGDMMPQSTQEEGRQIRPMVDRWEEFRAEELAYDEREEKDFEVLLRKQMEEEERRQKLAEERAVKAALKSSARRGTGGGVKGEPGGIDTASKGKKLGKADPDFDSVGRERSTTAGTGTPGPVEYLEPGEEEEEEASVQRGSKVSSVVWGGMRGEQDRNGPVDKGGVKAEHSDADGEEDEGTKEEQDAEGYGEEEEEEEEELEEQGEEEDEEDVPLAAIGVKRERADPDDAVHWDDGPQAGGISDHITLE